MTEEQQEWKETANLNTQLHAAYNELTIATGDLEQSRKQCNTHATQLSKMLHLTLWHRIKYVFLGIDYAREIVRIHS